MQKKTLLLAVLGSLALLPFASFADMVEQMKKSLQGMKMFLLAMGAISLLV